MHTGNNTDDFDDLDLISDLADGNDGQSTVSGAQDATSIPDNAVVTEQAERENKPAPTSLRDQLSSAFKPTTDTQEEKSAVAPIALTKDPEGRFRRPDGTFASTPEIEAFTAATTQPAVNTDTILAQLPAAVAEEFKSLPAKSQEFLARTMEDLNARASRYSEYDQLETLIGPRRDAWAQNGMTSLAAVSQLFHLSDFAGNNPTEFVLWFADQHGIDLDAALDARDAAQHEVSPELQQLRQQVQQLSAQVQGQQPVQPQNDSLQLVQSFATEKDEGGNLKRPYLPEVMPSFAAHVSAVRNAYPNLPADQVLSKAYENACWADANVRTKMQAEVDRQRRETARQRAENAKRATSSITGSPSGGGVTAALPSGDNLTLRDTLKQAFAVHTN